MKWTQAQQEAIEIKNQNILVSAAAGSGKTAVLVERIIRLVLEDKVDIRSLMVVTFTNAAAAEMKGRIRSRLNQALQEGQYEREYIRRQMIHLNNASISTMHAFCMELIRRHFYLIDVDPGFRLANEATTHILRSQAMEDLMEQLYQEENEEFLGLVDRYGGKRDDSNLVNIIQGMYSFVQSQPEPELWLQQSVQALSGGQDASWATYIQEDVAEKLTILKQVLNQAKLICEEKGGPAPYLKNIQQDLALIEDLEQKLDLGLAAFYDAIGQIKMSRLASITAKAMEQNQYHPAKKDRVKAIRGEVKEVLTKDLPLFSEGTSFEAQVEKMEQLIPYMNRLQQIVLRFGEVYRDKKRDKGLLDFHDLEHYALELLKNKSLQQELQQRFEYIFFDEYQDSNLVQETILQAIAREDNLFLVGDVKQSIYRFRLSDPTLFIRKYLLYSKDAHAGIKIDLSQNFRSRAGILEFSNFIFQRLMSPALGEISYDSDARLIPGISFPGEDSQVDLVLLENSSIENWEEGVNREDWEDLGTAEMEAGYVAARIQQLIGTMHYDPKEGIHRPVEYGDIVILMRSLAGRGEVFTKLLEEKNIPVFMDYNSSYFDVMEIRVLLDLLRIIDNVQQDEAMLAVMNSVIGDFTLEELAEIRSREDKVRGESFYAAAKNYGLESPESGSTKALRDKLDDFFKKIEHYAMMERLMSLEEFIWYLLDDTHYYAFINAMESGQERTANVQAFIEKAAQYESMNQGRLFGFLRYVDKLLKDKRDGSEAKTFSQQANRVRMMSIHKSKGLEFPIVFLCGIGKKFNKMDFRQDIMLHGTLGMGPKYVNMDLNTYGDTLAKKAIKKKANAELLSEELRILYVALTRAVDRLILVGTANSFAKLAENHLGETSLIGLQKKNSFLGWIMAALWDHPDMAPLRGMMEEPPDLQDTNQPVVSLHLELLTKMDFMEKEALKEEARHQLEENLLEPAKENDQLTALLTERMSYRYPYQDQASSPVKQSVTQLAGKETQLQIATVLPRFMEGKKRFSAAQKGTILHLVMQVAPLQEVSTLPELKKKVEELVEKEILSAEEQQAVETSKIITFLQSDIGKRMKASPAVYREQEFIMKRGEILVNGIIDCYFQEGDDLVLLDYKTDRVTDLEAILDKYRGQLAIYKEALEKSTGKKVKESILYLFDIGEEIKIKE